MSDEKKFEETSRDILVELRADMRHVRESMEKLQASEGKQWDKIDNHGAKIEGHEKSIGFLTKGFWIAVGGFVTVSGGIALWVVNHVPR